MKLMLKFFAVSSLFASPISYVAACGKKAPQELVGLTTIKNQIKEKLSRTKFESVEDLVNDLNNEGSLVENQIIGLVIGEEKNPEPKNYYDLLYLRAEVTKNTNDHVTIFYKVVDFDYNDGVKMIWGEEKSISFEVDLFGETKQPYIVKPEDQEIDATKSISLDIQVNNKTEGKAIVAKSNDSSIAQVSSNGNQITIKGIKEGQTTITLDYEYAKQVEFKVKVNALVPIIEPIVGFDMYENETKQVEVNITNPIGSELKASSEVTTVVGVEVSGQRLTFKANGIGESKITLVYAGAKNVTFTVKVKEKVVDPVIISPGNQEVKVGNKITKTITIQNPTSAQLQADEVNGNGAVKVSVSGNDITIEGLSAGTSTVNLSYTGANTVSFMVTILPKDPVINPINDITIEKGTTREVSVVIQNEVSGSTLNATSSDPNIVEIAGVSGNKVILNAKEVGEVTITLSYPNASDVTFKVTVSEQPPVVVPPVINKPNDIAIKVGQPDEIMNVSIDNKVDGVQLNAKSDNDAIATVNVNGDNLTIHAVNKGMAKITLTYNGAESKTFNVNVLPKDPIIDQVEDISLVEGEEKEITINIQNPIDGQKIVSSTSMSLVATVNASDNVVTIKAVKVGVAKITIGYSDATDMSFNVTVIEKETEVIPPSLTKPDKVSVEVGQSVSVEIKINNPIEGQSIFATPKDNTIANVSARDNKIDVTGVKEGTTTIKVDYENAESIEFEVEVLPEKIEDPVITAPKNISLQTDEEQTVKIEVKNPIDGEKISINNKNSDIAETTLINDFEFTVKGISVGSTTLVVSYKNAQSVEIKIVITEEPIIKPIIKPVEDIAITEGESTFVKLEIENKNDKFNVEIDNSNSEIAEVKPTGETLDVKALKVGTTEVTISYGIADTVKFKITVDEDNHEPKIVMLDTYYMVKGDETKGVIDIRNPKTDAKLEAESNSTNVEVKETSENTITLKAIEETEEPAVITINYVKGDEIYDSVEINLIVEKELFKGEVNVIDGEKWSVKVTEGENYEIKFKIAKPLFGREVKVKVFTWNDSENIDDLASVEVRNGVLVLKTRVTGKTGINVVLRWYYDEDLDENIIEDIGIEIKSKTEEQS
ncbi:hypothetical protein SCHIN_v1c05680 [Spiroplasma chinense]|uniref:BIG2 domain-containing protein n=1 Tax=Spiroplasma chinense TaxID=216932 RepID=A0A5B9Y4N1_9MOLU|nr:hypothetical protein [Spiroplasma chinense]QEH61765.1 hypothetical protein SCHIN_v1c05680 [Spiroplasma chinense]